MGHVGGRSDARDDVTTWLRQSPSAEESVAGRSEGARRAAVLRLTFRPAVPPAVRPVPLTSAWHQPDFSHWFCPVLIQLASDSLVVQIRFQLDSRLTTSRLVLVASR